MKIGLISGDIVDPLNIPNPVLGDISLFSYSLSRQCRYQGHVEFFYPVTQHMVLLSEVVPDHLKRAALIHDLHESILADMAYPNKVRLGDSYTQLERAIEQQIWDYWNVPYHLSEELKTWDRAICVDEMIVLNPKLPRRYLPDNQPLDVTVEPWRPWFEEADNRFMDRFYELFEEELKDRFVKGELVI